MVAGGFDISDLADPAGAPRACFTKNESYVSIICAVYPMVHTNKKQQLLLVPHKQQIAFHPRLPQDRIHHGFVWKQEEYFRRTR